MHVKDETKPNRFTEVCKQGHWLSASNLRIKQRHRRLSTGKVIHWEERCCQKCYAIWREEYNQRRSLQQLQCKGASDAS